MNVFKNPWKFYRAPFKWFKYLFRSFKYAYQRAVKGYCDLDLWELYTYYTNVIAGTLHELAESHMGYVEELGDEGWTTTLHEIASHMDESREESPNYPTPAGNAWWEHIQNMPDRFSDEFKQWEKEHELLVENMCKENEEHDKYRQEELNKAFDMLKKYWFDLWD